MPEDDVSYERWSDTLQETLSPLIPLDLLAETIDALLDTIRHNDIRTRPSDVDLDLADLENHALTLLLEEQLSPLVESTAWSLLASTILESLYAPEPDAAAPGRGAKIVACELCDRMMPLTVHHLIPRSTHAYFAQNSKLLDPPREKTTRAELALLQAMVCRPCHSMIHASVKNHRELAIHYASIERILQREDVIKWVSWIRTQRVSDKSMGRGIRYRR